MTAIDPSQLTSGERLRLAQLSQLRFIRVKNGYRVPGQARTIPLKTYNRLSELGLVREANERGRKTVVLTGAGRMTLGVIEEQKSQKGVRP